MNLESLFKMDYSIINLDSDTLLSFDLELNLSEFDMFGVGEIENLEENQNDDRMNLWTELQSNSLDMNAGFDLSYAVMVNPRSVMADMTNYRSISKNKVYESQSVASINDMERASDRTETPESVNWSLHQERNISESEPDDFYEATESEEENEEFANEEEYKGKNGQSLKKLSATNLNSTILFEENFIPSLAPQLAETAHNSSQSKLMKVNNIEIQKIKIVQKFEQTELLHRKTCNSNMQSRLVAQQKPHKSSRPTYTLKEDQRDCAESEQDIYNSLCERKCYPKPTYSYSCLIAMALKNSQTGLLPVSEIYKFMCDHFPYFKTAPSGWKNSVRHNLSLNKCFEKVEKADTGSNQRKGCLWAINSSRKQKMDEEMKKWSTKDRSLILSSLLNPEFLELLENGEMKHLYQNSEERLHSVSETEYTFPDELDCAVGADVQSLCHKNSKKNSSTNFDVDSQDESSKDDIERIEKRSIDGSIEDSVQLQFNVPTTKDFAANESNQLKETSIYAINPPSVSSIYEVEQTNDSPVYQFSLPSDSPVYHANDLPKIIPVYQFKKANSNTNSCSSWSSSNSNTSNSDEYSPHDKDKQTDNNSEYKSNQRSNKRQKSFMGVIQRIDYNTKNSSFIEVRRKVPISRS
ncbi:uncharacterized protein LOC106645178 [Copidosoma floridanum]|uniref:uncharacterized protein LOC106645178 n=1 Tax=Copidosoma floridanum TaxID=29053 RepID=UPI0006C96D79|nr:uncharacterized protein LOC106645178 [Copidosoma floridanum]